MIPFHEFKGIEVSGRNVLRLVQAFGQFKSIASQILKNGRPMWDPTTGRIKVLHDDTLPCRKKGHASCVYVVRA
jgi:hypothetical protein